MSMDLNWAGNLWGITYDFLVFLRCDLCSVDDRPKGATHERLNGATFK